MTYRKTMGWGRGSIICQFLQIVKLCQRPLQSHNNVLRMQTLGSDGILKQIGQAVISGRSDRERISIRSSHTSLLKHNTQIFFIHLNKEFLQLQSTVKLIYILPGVVNESLDYINSVTKQQPKLDRFPPFKQRQPHSVRQKTAKREVEVKGFRIHIYLFVYSHIGIFGHANRLDMSLYITKFQNIAGRYNFLEGSNHLMLVEGERMERRVATARVLGISHIKLQDTISPPIIFSLFYIVTLKTENILL